MMLKALNTLLVLVANVGTLALDETLVDSVAPAGFNITSISVLGSGCPSGSASFALEFNKFYTLAGTGIPISQSRKNCQTSLGVSIPDGWSFAVNTVSYKGYHSLDSGVSATHKTYNYFSGKLEQPTCSQTLTGPSSGWYSRSDEFEPTNWSDCGGDAIVGINTSVQVQKTSASSDPSLDIRTDQDYGFVFKRC